VSPNLLPDFKILSVKKDEQISNEEGNSKFISSLLRYLRTLMILVVIYLLSN